MTVNQGHTSHGELLRRFVEDSDQSPAEVAEKLGVHRTHLYKLYEKEVLDDKYLRRLKKHFGFDLGSTNYATNETIPSTKEDDELDDLPELLRFGLKAMKDHDVFITAVAKGLVDVHGVVKGLEKKVKKHTEEIKKVRAIALGAHSTADDIRKTDIPRIESEIQAIREAAGMA